MRQKSQLINAYLDISPQIFSMRQDINNKNTQYNTVDLNEKIFDFVNDLICLQPLDENDRNIPHPLAPPLNSSALSSSNQVTKKKLLEDNQNILKDHLHVLATVNSNYVNHT